MPVMETEIDISRFKKLLEQRRAELLAAEQSTKDSTRPVELDQTSVGRLSRMDAMQVQAMAVAEGTRRKQALRRIDAAFERLESGDYGYCVSCDEPIAEKRLELDPATATCIRCASGNA